LRDKDKRDTQHLTGVYTQRHMHQEKPCTLSHVLRFASNIGP